MVWPFCLVEEGGGRPFEDVADGLLLSVKAGGHGVGREKMNPEVQETRVIAHGKGQENARKEEYSSKHRG